MPSIPNLALRGLQLFFSILILGLSGHLVASQAYGGAPSATNYNVFLGIWLFVTAVMGLAATVIEVLGGIVGVVADGLSVLFAFAGGVAYAAKLGAHSCSRIEYTGLNSIINGGVKDGKFGPGINLKHRCQEAQADTAFIWFAFATALGCLALGLLSWRRGGK